MTDIRGDEAPIPADAGVLVLRPDDGATIDNHGALIRRKASRKQTGGSWAVGTGVQNAGFLNPLHTHDEPEAFYVLEGRYTFLAEDGEIDAPRGTFVFIPPGAQHGFRTEEDGSALFCIWPSTVEDMFFGNS